MKTHRILTLIAVPAALAVFLMPLSGCGSRESTAPGTNPAKLETSSDADGQAKTTYRAAQDTLKSGDYAAALQKYDDFLKRYPAHEHSGHAQFWKAACLLNLNKNEEAVQEFEKLRSNYPTNNRVPMAIRSQAVALSRLDKKDEAVKLLHELVAKYPGSPATEMAERDLKAYEGPSPAQP